MQLHHPRSLPMPVGQIKIGIHHGIRANKEQHVSEQTMTAIGNKADGACHQQSDLR